MQTIETVVVSSQSELALGFAPEQSRVTPLVTKSGKLSGQRFTFNGETLTEFKSRLKDSGLNSEARRVAVQQWLNGDSAKRANMEAAALVSALASGGYVAEKADVRGTSASLRFVRPKVAEPKKSATVDELKAEIERLKAQLAAK